MPDSNYVGGPTTPSDILLQRIIVDETSLWKDLVFVSEKITKGYMNLDATLNLFTIATKKSPQSTKRKIQAICYLLRQNVKPETIIERGPTEVLSVYAQSFSSANEKMAMLKIPASLKDSFLAQLDRIGAVIGNNTRQGQLELINSILSGLEKEDILHLAGGAHK